MIVIGPPGHHFAQDTNFYKPGTSIEKLKTQVANWQKIYGTQREQHQPGSQPQVKSLTQQVDCSILIAGLIRYGSDGESDEEIINCFAVQSFEANCRNNGFQYNISAAMRNAGRRGGHREDKRDFLKP